MKWLLSVLAVAGLLIGSVAWAGSPRACERGGVVYENPGRYPAVCDPGPDPTPEQEEFCSVYADWFVEEGEYEAAVMAWHALIGPYVMCRWQNYWDWIEEVVGE